VEHLIAAKTNEWQQSVDGLEHAAVPNAICKYNRIILYNIDADRGPGLPESAGCAFSAD
jgi:hypothetical protein